MFCFLCRGVCFQEPALTAADKQWDGRDADSNSEDELGLHDKAKAVSRMCMLLAVYCLVVIMILYFRY